MPSSPLILCHPLLFLPSIFSSIKVFSSELVLTSGHLSIGASASVLSMNIQGGLPLGLTSLISLQSKGLARVFSSTTVPKRQFFSAQPSFGPALTPIQDCWRNIALPRWTFAGKVMSLLFNILSGLVRFPPKERVSLNFMAVSLSTVIWEPKEKSPSLFPLFPHLFAMKWWDQLPWS